MLALPNTNSWGFQYTNQTNGTSGTSIGTAVTFAASDGAGTWTEIASAASLTSQIWYLHLWVSGLASSGSTRTARMDFGVDPSGGTSYTVLFSNWLCGAAGLATSSNGKALHFPCSIPAGSSIAVRGGKAAAGTVATQVWGHFYGKPSRPELWRRSSYAETLGFVSGSLGTSFTPGNAGWGSWASLGTTTKKHFHTQMGIQVDNTTMNNEGTRVQVGVGDGTNMDIICDNHHWTNTNETSQMILVPDGDWEIPSGATLYVRGNCSGAPATGYNATAVCFGG